MELYFAIFAIILLTAAVDFMKPTRSESAIALGIAFFPIVLLAGLRDRTGNDWTPYFEYYQSLRHLDDKAEDFEIGYRLFSFFFKELGFSYQQFLFASTVAFCTGFYYSFRKNKSPVLITLLFFCTYFLGWMGTARQVLAIACTVVAGECLIDRRYLGFLIWTAIGATFHQTAAIFLLAYFMVGSIATPRKYLLIIASCGLIGAALPAVLPTILERVSGVPGLAGKVQFYIELQTEQLDYASGEGLQYLWYVKRLFFFFLLLYFRDQFNTPRLRFALNAYTVSVAIFLLIQPSIPILATRGANYFSIYELYLIAALAHHSRPNLRPILLSMIILISGQRIYTSLFAYHPDLFIPYKGIMINEDMRREPY